MPTQPESVSPLLLFGGALLLVGGLVLLVRRPQLPAAPSTPPPPPSTPSAPPSTPPVVVRPAPPPAARAPGQAGQGDDTEALARMLVSETRDPGARVVLGWIALQVARRRGVSIFQLLTQGQGYGPQNRGGVAFYASTRQGATPDARDLAWKLLSGQVQPSEAIRAHQVGAFVEQGQGLSDDQILALQQKWNQGIFARIQGTRWFLFSRDTPAVASLVLIPDLPSV